VRQVLLIAALATSCWALVAGGHLVWASDGTPASGTKQPATRAQPAPARWSVTDPGQGPVTLAKGDTGAREMGGITWAGGTRYYAVSDKLAKLFPLSVAIDPQNGTITHAAIEPAVPLSGSTDLEGIAYDPEHRTVLISDEVGPSIREYRVTDGRLVRSITVPPVYRSARTNLSLESLALAPDRSALWTVNEETLSNDGPLSNFTTGSAVRLQRFGPDYEPNGEWVYQTDALVGDMLRPGRDIESSGVSDLVALPGGDLLVLERAYGARGLRIRLYAVDLAGATDVAALPSLIDAKYTPVRKTLLWQQVFPNINFEGAALGPRLDGGAYSLVLISDDGHQQRQALYALTVNKRE
jgi:hypothetical protein